MRRVKRGVIAATLMATLSFIVNIAHATPSTTYWTPMTPDIQSFGVLHIGVDNYFTVLRNSDNGAGSLPTDAGLTMGVLPFETLRMEVGADWQEPSDAPFSFNAKIGVLEDSLFKWSPALQVGIFNVGTVNNVNNQNIGYAVIGKTVPWVGGRLSIGPYVGNGNSLVDGDGDADNTGFMVAYDHGFMPIKDKEGNEFNRLVVAADYASGNNALGGGGCGMYYYFMKDISLLTGPVWYNEEAINGKWKWTIQLDINLQVFGK